MSLNRKLQGSSDPQPVSRLGWRSFWSPANGGEEHKWQSNQDISFGTCCKSCHDMQVVRSRSIQNSRLYDSICELCLSDGHQCLLQTSYRYHPFEDVDIGRVLEYDLRVMARKWKSALDNPDMIDTTDQARFFWNTDAAPQNTCAIPQAIFIAVPSGGLDAGAGVCGWSGCRHGTPRLPEHIFFIRSGAIVDTGAYNSI